MKLPLLPTTRAQPRTAMLILLLALLGQRATAQKVFYRMGGPTASLKTAHQVDSIIQVFKRKKSASMTLTKRIIRTVTRPDTIIYELALGLINEGVAKAEVKYETFMGKPLPAFVLTDLAGQPVHSADLLGHPVVISMWFTSCAPCVAEMPALNKMQAEQAGSDVVFLAITYEPRSKVQAFLTRQAFTFRHLSDAASYCAQFTNSYPISLFVDRAGIVRRIEGSMSSIMEKPGMVSENNFRAALELITKP